MNGLKTVSILLLSTLACTRPDVAFPQSGGGSGLEGSYDFGNPDAVIRMPRILNEISGLTVLDDRHLGAVQDEEGRLFILDIQTGELIDDLKFGKKGDYEGIERVGNRVFVLRNDGTLFEIEDWQAEHLVVKNHKTPLKQKHDTEGLAYDPVRNRLLIACKEYAGKGLKGTKAVYEFDLAAEELLEDPAYVIDIDAFNDRIATDGVINQGIRQFFSPLMDLSGFKPSAIAVHPLTHLVYVLSSVRKALLVLDDQGNLVDVIALSDSLFEQPEGLCFLPNGDLFIASEKGDRDFARILRFNYSTL